MSEESTPPNGPESIKPDDIGWDDGLCALCGRPTARAIVGAVEIARGEEYKEPFVCNKCLLDLRGDIATELEVRKQLQNLDARVQGLDTKVWAQTFAFNVAVALVGFLVGVVVTLLFN